jgi:hypothetical protein
MWQVDIRTLRQAPPKVGPLVANVKWNWVSDPDEQSPAAESQQRADHEKRWNRMLLETQSRVTTGCSQPVASRR